jgi:2'-5' RNA ligase
MWSANNRDWSKQSDERMKTFRHFVEQKNQSRKYVAIVYDDETQKKMREWCHKNGFDLTKKYNGEDQAPEDFDFHTTVFYSVNEVSMKNKELRLTHGEAFPRSFKLLGENKDIPVLVVSSSDLNALRNIFEHEGLKDKWADYVPHISLSYVRKDYDLSGLKLPDFRMTFGVLKIEDISEDV